MPAAARTVFLLLTSLFLMGLSGLLVGARLASDLVGGLGPVVTVVLGVLAVLALCALPPLVGAARVLGLFEGKQVHRPTITLSVISAWNALLLLGMLALMPVSTGEALAAHGTWFLAGTPQTQVRHATSWAGETLAGLGTTDTAEPETAEAVPEAPPLELDVSEVALPPAAPEEPEVFNAADIFTFRADSVVVIEVQKGVDDSLLGEISKRLGVDVVEGHGSGFAVADGHILTNHHVVEGAERMTVVTHDGTRLQTRVIAQAASHDLALLQVEGADLAAIDLATEVPSPGSRTFAIGAPLGLDYTLTDGIVSAHRTIGPTQFLQMQTPIAPGSSGGPLFNDAGQVIGINTATAGGGNMNLAVLASHAQDLLDAEHSVPEWMPLTTRSASVSQLRTEGFELHPTEHMQIEQLATFLHNAVDECFTDMPDTPVVLVAARGIDVSGVEGETLICVRNTTRDLSLPMTFFLDSLSMPKDGALSIAWDSGLTVQIRRTPAPAAAEPEPEVEPDTP